MRGRGRPASDSGLGAAVVGTVSRPSAVLLTLAVLLGVTLTAWALDLGPVAGWPAAVGLGLATGGRLTATCVRRLGGVSGDVLGASLEATTAAALVAAALLVVAVTPLV
jgi:adenosylcobinamide-GDP ribazoletransferase